MANIVPPALADIISRLLKSTKTDMPVQGDIALPQRPRRIKPVAAKPGLSNPPLRRAPRHHDRASNM